jgi:hypothetical protein
MTVTFAVSCDVALLLYSEYAIVFVQMSAYCRLIKYWIIFSLPKLLRCIDGPDRLIIICISIGRVVAMTRFVQSVSLFLVIITADTTDTTTE